MARYGIAAATLVLALVGWTPAFSAEIGVATAVNPRVQGTPPEAVSRLIRVGTNVVENERVETSDVGRTQVLFLDGTSLTLGPDADLVLDKFVYDAEAKTGELVMTATTGVFRIVGGRISKKTPIILKTASSRVALRGGIALATVVAGALRSVSFLYGEEMRLTDPTGASVKANFRRPGFEVVLDDNENVVSTGPIKNIEQKLSALEGKETKTEEATSNPEGNASEGTGSGSSSGSETGTSGGTEGDTSEETSTTQSGGEGGDTSGGTAEATQTASNDGAAIETRVKSNISNLNSGDPAGPTGLVVVPTSLAAATPLLPATNTVTSVESAISVADTVSTLGTDSSASALSFPGTYAGYYVSLINFTSTQGGSFIDADSFPADRNIAFSGFQVKNGALTGLMNGQLLKLPVLNQGEFTFGSAGTQTPFGPVSGSAFFDPAFFFYTLDEVTPANGSAQASIFGGAPYTGAFPTSGYAAYTFNFGIMPPAAVGGDFITDADVSPFYVVYGPDYDNTPPFPTSRTGFVGLEIEGQGALQRSVVFGSTGSLILDHDTGQLVNGVVAFDGKVTNAGFLHGFARPEAVANTVRFGWGTSLRDGGTGDYFFGIDGPDFFATDTRIFAYTPGSAGPTDAGIAYHTTGTVGVEENFHTSAYFARAETPEGFGNSRTEARYFGYSAGGTGVRPGAAEGGGDPRGYSFRGELQINDPFGNPSSPSAQTNLTLFTYPSQNRADAIVWADAVAGNEPRTIYRFGSTSGRHSNNSSFFDDTHFIMQDRNESSSNSNPYPASIVAHNAPQGAVPFENHGNAQYIFFPVTMLPDGALDDIAPEGGFCECKFVTWGFWSGRFRAGPGSADEGRQQSTYLATWVAGTIPDEIEMPMTGTANYAGHAIANMRDGGARYIAAGRFNHSWDFAAGMGTVTISNLDGKTYTGATAVQARAIDFKGNLTDNSGVNGGLTGSFAKGGGDPTYGQIGHFSFARTVDPSAFGGVGTFAAKKVSSGN